MRGRQAPVRTHAESPVTLAGDRPAPGLLRLLADVQAYSAGVRESEDIFRQITDTDNSN